MVVERRITALNRVGERPHWEGDSEEGLEGNEAAGLSELSEF